MQDTMLEEAIYKFRVSGPTIMPSLFDNYYLKGTEEFNGYAILTYEVNPPLPIDDVLSIMDGDGYMRILYYTCPDPTTVSTWFGQRACTYFMPEEQRNIKMNFSTDVKGLVSTILVTVYGSIDIMYPDLVTDLRLNTEGSVLVRESRSEAAVMNDFNNNP
jgi:hypothetical protein